MANSPILEIPLLSTGQSNKETTINDMVQYLEAAMNEAQTLNFTAGNLTLAALDLKRYFVFSATNVSAARDLTVPDAKRTFCLDNRLGANAITVKRGSGSVTVDAGAVAMVHLAGGDNIMLMSNSAWGGSLPFTGLSDVPSSYTGHGGKGIRVNVGETGLEFYTPGDSLDTILELTDVPDAYGSAGQALVVNATTDGLEFASVATAFIGLSDAPSDYTGAAGFFVRVTEGEDGLEFAEAGDLISSFVQLSDVPSDYEGAAGFVVAVNDEENGLEFVPAGGGGGAVAFVDLTDVPDDYTGDAGKFVRVNATEDALEFANVGDSIADFTDLNDVPSDYADAGGFFLRVTSGEDGIEFTLLSFEDIADVDMSTPPTDGQVLVWDNDVGAWVPGAGTGGGGATDFIDLEDAPSSYTGAGGFLVAVTEGEDGLEFIDPSEIGGTAEYPDFTGHAGDLLAVTSGEDDVEWVDPPVGVTHVAISFFVGGTPTANEIATRYTVVDDFSIPSGAAGSFANLVTGPSGGSIVFDMQKNGSSFGTITFSSGGTTGSFSVGTTTAFTAGDKIDFVSPANLRASEDLSVSILGTI